MIYMAKQPTRKISRYLVDRSVVSDLMAKLDKIILTPQIQN